MPDRLTANEVGIDLKRYKSERAQRGRLDNGHVISGTDGRTRHVASSAPSHVRRTRHHLRADRIDNAGIVESLEQRERVAASDRYCLRLFYRRKRVVAAM